MTITAAGPGIAIITVTALDRAANAVGDDDNTGVTQSIIARVTANMAPTAEGSIPSQEVIQGGSVELDMAKYFNDPDGNNTLVYTAASSVETCGHGCGNRQRRDDHGLERCGDRR